MIVDDKWIVCRDKNEKDVKIKEANQYCQKEYSAFDAKEINSSDCNDVCRLYGDKWEGFVSFQLYQDVDPWIMLDESLFIGRDFETYCQIAFHKILQREHIVYLYIKFTKSLVTEICEAINVTKEQAISILQFASFGFLSGELYQDGIDRRPGRACLTKMLNDFIPENASVLNRIINGIADISHGARDHELDKIQSCIPRISLQAYQMMIAISVLCKNEPVAGVCWKHVNERHHFLSPLYKDSFYIVDEKELPIQDTNAMTLDEADDIVYTDDVKKLFNQKGWDVHSYGLEMLSSSLSYYTSNAYARSTHYSTVDVGGLSHFGNKLSRIL